MTKEQMLSELKRIKLELTKVQSCAYEENDFSTDSLCDEIDTALKSIDYAQQELSK